jgi:hypothetical protein
MSVPQSDEKAQPDKVQSNRASGIEKYLRIVAGGILLALLDSKNQTGQQAEPSVLPVAT